MRKPLRIRDNRGVTLLEVIVAMAIFAIVAVVLLNGFFATGRTNKKSVNYQKATALAQSLMEGVKTNNLEEVARQINYPWDVQKDIPRFSFLTMTDDLKLGIQKGWTGSTDSDAVVIREVNRKGRQPGGYSSVTSDNSGKTYSFQGQSTGQYFFQLHNVPMNNQRFDATVTIDGVNSVTSDDGGGSDHTYKDSTKSDKPNNYENPVLTNMDLYHDAFLVAGAYTQDGSLDRMALKDMMDKKANYDALYPGRTPATPTIDELAKDRERDINLTISKSGGSTKVHVKYTAFSPKMKSFSCPGDLGVHDGNGECFCTYVNENSIYDNSDTTISLENVYLIYCPNYSSTSSGSNTKDRIKLSNPDNLAVNFYLIKQKSTSLNTEELKAAEMLYKMNLTIEETPKANWNTLASRYRGVTKLRTNINSNIAYDSQKERDENQNAGSQMFLTYRAVNTGRSVNSSAGKVALVFKITQMKDLESSEQKYRLFSVHVAVYEAGTLASGEPGTWKDKQVLALDGSTED